MRKRPEECDGRRSTIRPDVASEQQTSPEQPPEHWGITPRHEPLEIGGRRRGRPQHRASGRDSAGDLLDRAGSDLGCDVCRQAVGALPVVNRGPAVVPQ